MSIYSQHILRLPPPFLSSISSLTMAPNPNISSLFQELLFNKKEETVIEEEGSDFKRLLHKNKKIPSNYSISSMSTNSSRIHKDSPDYNSVVYLNTTSVIKKKNRFDFFGLFNRQEEDRYFNSNRNELSKDIFPSDK